MVVAYHYTSRFDELYGYAWGSGLQVAWGGYGVKLFFILSGFVIFMTLERIDKWWIFLVSRFARLYPAYWFSVALTFCVVFIIGLNGREVSIGQFLVNLTMLQQWLRIPHVDGVYSTLSLELAFYFWMLLVYCIGLMKRISIIMYGWLGLMVLVVGLEREMNIILPGMVHVSLLLRSANMFFIGIVFYQLYRRRSLIEYLPIVFACLMVEALLHDWTSACICALLAGVFSLSVLARIRLVTILLSCRPLLFLGAISYPLYLIHQNVGYVCLRAFQKLGVPRTLAMLATFLLVLSIAAVVHYAVENPARRRIRAMASPRHSAGLALERLDQA